jgi:nucleoside-diphosphate-sugar epimerase
MPAQNRQKVVIAGAGGSIGAAFCRDLARKYDIIAIVGSEERVPDRQTDPSLSWRYCELSSRQDVEQAIGDCDYIIYLVHTRLPTARLDQAESENMDLLIADNVARAARLNGIKQIVYLGGLIPEGDLSSEFRKRRNEVIEALSNYGTPLTVIRAGLVVAPGSNAVRLLANIATRLPIVLIPHWADRRKQPTAVTDVIRAIRYCLGNPETYGKDYDIGGPLVLTFRHLLHRASISLKKKHIAISVPYFPARLYAWYLRFLDRHAHPALIRLFVEALGHDLIARDNPLQQFIAENSVMPRQMIDPYIKKYGQIPSNPRLPFLKKYVAGLRSKSNVRSIQRIVLPQGHNATWVADTFFKWLPHFARPFVLCEVSDTGTCRIFNRFPRLHLLTLSFQQKHSSPDRRMYFITGGLLARGHNKLKPRLEFRDVLGDRYTIAAIHDFRPRLPWGFYALTQAVIHLIAMRKFQKYMIKRGA